MTESNADGQVPAAAAESVPAAQSPFSNGAGAGGGSLPHRDATASAAFAIGEFEISSIPTLPNLLDDTSIAGGATNRMSVVAQAVAGIPGVSIADGRLVTDTALFANDATIGVDLEDVAFAGMRSFLTLASKISLDGTPVTWHYPGPVTLGTALHDAGIDAATAFALAIRAIRTQLVQVAALVAAVLPNSPQLVMLDEPALAQLMSPDFPIPPDHAIDMMSSGMAALASTAVVGIHCDQPCDVATMLASGPGVVSVPVSTDLVAWAGYLNRFLDDGGVIAWGAVPTAGPVAGSAERHWRGLSDVWCELVRRGCDPVALRRQTMVTPAGGLGDHSVSTARRIARMNADIAKRVKDQANATRFALGA